MELFSIRIQRTFQLVSTNNVRVIKPVKKNNIREKREEAKRLQLNLFD